MTEDIKYDLYTIIETALETISEIKHVIKYNSQDLNNEKIHQLNYPQAWMQMSSITWDESMLTAHRQNLTQEQKGNIEITVYIAQHSMKDNNETWKPDLSLINKVYRAVTNVSGDGFSPLQRISERDDISNDNVRIWEIVFSTKVTECGVSRDLEDATPVTLIINKTIN